ncbi:glycine cleavage system protein GcvH [Pandoraea pneumonica]|uniref:glycine cleavage system protein GcvH n=1 Tax=Pandoraea pneumonica TaxID=2508299 RepID=UPI003CF2CAA4
MANTPDNLKYAESHEWARLEADGTVTIGITDHAQEALGDVVFIELPDTGRTVKAQEQVAVVESVKAASDIYAPIGGEIIETNSEVAGSPEQINSDPYANWLFRIKPTDAKELDGLLTAEQYNAGPGA